MFSYQGYIQCEEKKEEEEEEVGYIAKEGGGGGNVREDKEDCRKAVKIHHVRQVCFGVCMCVCLRGDDVIKHWKHSEARQERRS